MQRICFPALQLPCSLALLDRSWGRVSAIDSGPGREIRPDILLGSLQELNPFSVAMPFVGGNAASLHAEVTAGRPVAAEEFLAMLDKDAREAPIHPEPAAAPV